jgi:single-strand DNA-binding protein
MIVATVSGTLGRDAELGDKRGTPVASFSVASNERGKGGTRETVWVSCRLYGKRATALAQYLTKGTKVAVAGSLRTWVHDGQARVGLDVNEVDLLGGGERNGSARHHSTAAFKTDDAVGIDDIPF